MSASIKKETLSLYSVELTVTSEDIDNIMYGALEGGVTAMWCEKVTLSPEGADYLGESAAEQISRGGCLTFYLLEPFEGVKMTYELSIEKFLEGLKKFFVEPYFELRTVRAKDGTYRLNEVDALEADAIIQYALFDEYIFG